MANQRGGQTAVDYVTIVLSPVLIIGLVGSLVFFLLEVFYHSSGPWKDRLQWILFFYVFGAVLVSRISMMGEIASRFWMYGSVLAILTYVGLQGFVEYPPTVKPISFAINLLLVVLIWWCAHRLTWDCTNIDEAADISGEGVLQAAGLEADSYTSPKREEAADADDRTIWQRWKEYRERRSKKRTLGVWVIYFALATLPIFGLGQALIPLTAPERRRFSFYLMIVYVACGLGLLLTTCFLGLRRYLRQKKLQMPASMTGAWLTVGGMLIVGLLLIGAFLPRPYSESSLLDVVDPAGSAKRKANRLAMKGDSPGEGQGQPGQQGDPNAKDAGKSGKDGKGPGQDKDGKQPGKGDSKDGKGSQQDKDKGGKGDKSSKDGESGKDKDKGGQQKDKGQPKDGEKGKGNKDGGQQQKDASKGMKNLEQAEKSAPSSSSPLASVQQFLEKIALWLKWIVFGLIAILVVVALFRGGLGFLANFSKWAKGLLDAWKRLWERLFGGAKVGEGSVEEEAGDTPNSMTPFSAYANPFDTGRADSMSARQLVRYTFAALEAWARERGLERRGDETAIEFAARLGDEVPGLEAEARRLAQLHARAEYAPGSLPATAADTLRAFWEKLDKLAGASLSA